MIGRGSPRAQRTSRDRGERGPRADAPMPMPTPATPPPTGGVDEELDLAAELDGVDATFEAAAEVEATPEVEAVGAPTEEG